MVFKTKSRWPIYLGQQSVFIILHQRNLLLSIALSKVTIPALTDEHSHSKMVEMVWNQVKVAHVPVGLKSVFII
jgi:hypothetical protein